MVDISGCDIMLVAEWLSTLWLVTMDFQELYMRVKDCYTHILQGIQEGPLDYISSHCMEKLLKKGHSSIISQIRTIQAVEASPLELPTNLQKVLNNHIFVFELPKGIPPLWSKHDHSIPLLLDSQPPNVEPYRYPFPQKIEIEKII